MKSKSTFFCFSQNETISFISFHLAAGQSRPGSENHPKLHQDATAMSVWRFTAVKLVLSFAVFVLVVANNANDAIDANVANVAVFHGAWDHCSLCHLVHKTQL